MEGNDGPPRSNQRQRPTNYPPPMYGYQYDPQWFAQQQAMMHQHMMQQQQAHGWVSLLSSVVRLAKSFVGRWTDGEEMPFMELRKPASFLAVFSTDISVWAVLFLRYFNFWTCPAHDGRCVKWFDPFSPHLGWNGPFVDRIWPDTSFQEEVLFTKSAKSSKTHAKITL